MMNGKKIAILSLSLMLGLSGTVFAQTQATTTTGIINQLKESVVQDVTNALTSSVTDSVNQIKLANYKSQLEAKKKELTEVDASNTLAIVKYFKKAMINQKISELEAKIAEIENSEKNEKGEKGDTKSQDTVKTEEQTK